jgi:hypothetical protein
MLHLNKSLLHLLDRGCLHGILSLHPQLLFKGEDLLELVFKLLTKPIDHGCLYFELIKG